MPDIRLFWMSQNDSAWRLRDFYPSAGLDSEHFGKRVWKDSQCHIIRGINGVYDISSAEITTNPSLNKREKRSGENGVVFWIWI